MIDVKMAKSFVQDPAATEIKARRDNRSIERDCSMWYRYDALSDLTLSDQGEKCSQGGKKW